MQFLNIKFLHELKINMLLQFQLHQHRWIPVILHLADLMHNATTDFVHVYKIIAEILMSLVDQNVLEVKNVQETRRVSGINAVTPALVSVDKMQNVTLSTISQPAPAYQILQETHLYSATE